MSLSSPLPQLTRWRWSVLSTDWLPCVVRVIYVCGAGRGPLVAGVLKALERSNRTARVYAIEKNASAFVTCVPLLRPPPSRLRDRLTSVVCFWTGLGTF